MRVEFDALEYGGDGRFAPVRCVFEGDTEAGWTVLRNGAAHLTLGAGYRLLRVISCGVCSTDLARRFLPFPLPQITGHEVLAEDEEGRRCVVEINASHLARGEVGECPFCRGGLATHCPERLVLGIHDLPGGFGPWILAPRNAVLPLPDEIPDDAGVLVEPLAAALNAVDRIQARAGETIAVLGPRRLGMLVVAALAARRNAGGCDFRILALARHPHLLDLASRFGATDLRLVEGGGTALPDGLADVVIDTTGNPEAFELAIRLARREVHLKSTHGQPAGGVEHLTEFVVDELRLVPFAELEAEEAPELPRPLCCVVGDTEQFSRAIRPVNGREEAAIMPRGQILLRHDADVGNSPLLRAVRDRGLQLSSSRCGDFRSALDLLGRDAGLREIGARLITHRFPAANMAHAFEVAAAPDCVKAVIEH
jgi:threonine dehydrogenase-like Zn-dependent dehydrogenase